MVVTAAVMLNPSVPAPAAGAADDPFVAVAPNLAPTELTKVGDTLFFTGYDTEHKRELWKSDGTIAGTVLVRDITPEAGFPPGPRNLTAVGDTLFFTTDDGIHGEGLWKSDGTRRGTILVKDIDPREGRSGYPGYFTAASARLFFVALDGTHGSELWTSNGTRRGTVLVKDIDRHDRYSYYVYPNQLTAVGSTVFFVHDNGIHGHELWRSDGTRRTTRMVGDLAPGSVSSHPSEITAVGRMLFFDARDSDSGANSAYSVWRLRRLLPR